MVLAAPARAQSPAYTPAPVPDATAVATVRPNPAGSRFYGSVEYLNWSVKDAPLSIPLVSTGPSQNKEGFLVNAGTTILYGAPFAPALGGRDHQGFPDISGSRLTLGYRLDLPQLTAVELSGFALARRSVKFSAGGNTSGGPGIRIPVFSNVAYAPGGGCDIENASVCLVRGEDGVPVFLPDAVSGRVTIRNTLQLWGADLTGVRTLAAGSGWELSGLAGPRYLQLSEGLGLTDTIVGVPGTFFDGQRGTANDSFKTSNRFYGAALGLRGTYAYGPFSAELTGRLAVGLSHEVLSVQGIYRDAGPTMLPANAGQYGIFAQPANEGRFSANKFAVVPDLQIKLGYDITPAFGITVGYSALYDSNVIRPGDQMTRNIPKGQTFQQDGTAPSTTSPARLFRTSDFFAHGLNAGVRFHF
ncbi:MAG: hypothetical protein NVSMB18_08760 [Acetobacteraceae bacterium]